LDRMPSHAYFGKGDVLLTPRNIRLIAERTNELIAAVNAIADRLGMIEHNTDEPF
jgi:hypothetical protein